MIFEFKRASASHFEIFTDLNIYLPVISGLSREVTRIVGSRDLSNPIHVLIVHEQLIAVK